MSQSMARRFLVLFTGTAAAQLLPVISAPLIARQYDTAEFGVFGIYIAASTICATVCNLKYDNVVLTTTSRSLTASIFGLSIIVNVLIGILIACAIVLGRATGLTRQTTDGYGFALFLPLSLLLAGLLQILSNVALQRENFAAVARSRIAIASITTASSMIAALSMPTARALIISSLLGQGVGVTLLSWLSVRTGHLRPNFNVRRLYAVASLHWRFALFTSPADLLNALASNLPALFLATLYGTTATGAYVLTQRLIGTPLMLIGSALADLYRQRVGQRAAVGRPYWDVSVRMLSILSTIGMLVLFVICLLGQDLATSFLGAQWKLVGDMAVIMVWVYVARFIVSPLTFSFYVARRHIEDLALQAISAITVGTIFWLAKQMHLSLTASLLALSSVLLIMYLTYGIRAMQFSRQSQRSGYTQSRGATP
ncbi:lipopolysaccharide biosynthesis protein [Roseateles sp.]|uniref:lipopolysaccharide biosynthesis protein n=1 Tax=Roseateles sp. TaxID=1971397 RepID=UPI002E06FFBC|nr:oligosaccharide flippase family protein [Roseateles sp.]